jgi:hypothetical protein
MRVEVTVEGKRERRSADEGLLLEKAAVASPILAVAKVRQSKVRIHFLTGIEPAIERRTRVVTRFPDTTSTTERRSPGVTFGA